MNRSIAAALAMLTLAACGHSAPTTLHSISAAPPQRSYAGYAGLPVAVEAVRLPPAIDRVEMLRETAPSRYAVLEFDRWVAPPARLARQALTEDLAARLPVGAIAVPAGGEPRPVTRVSVDVLSFSATGSGAVLTAQWTRGCRPGGAAASRYLQLQDGASDTATALARLIGQIADRIAADLAAMPDVGCAPAPKPR